MPARPYLVPGSVVALHLNSAGTTVWFSGLGGIIAALGVARNALKFRYNRPANRFLRMHSTFMDGSGHPPHPPNFPENWGWERFKVVDAGFLSSIAKVGVFFPFLHLLWLKGCAQCAH